MTQFFMAMVPPTTTHQTKKITVRKGKPVVYEDERLKATREKFLAHLSKHVPDEPYSCGVRVIVKWLFPITGSKANGDYKITRPDIDNLDKLLKDCMTKLGFWKDDSLICSAITEKFHGDPPGIWIHIEEVAND